MVAMQKQAAWALGLSSFLGWAVVACSSFSVSDAPDAQASLPDAADDRTVPVGQDASTEDAGPSDAPLPGAKCSVRTVSTVPGVQRVQRYLDKLYFSDATTVYVCKAANCTPDTLAKNENNVRSLTVGAGYAFWLATPDDGSLVPTLRRLDLSNSSVATIPAPGELVSLHLTSGANPQLVMMGGHLYRASPSAANLTVPDYIEFYYQPQDVALTSVGESVLYNHPTPTVSEPGPRRCNEGSTCTNAPPIVAVRAAISALTLDNFQGTDRLYYAYGSSLYRAAIGATGVDGGAPVPGAPLASFNGTVSFVSASGTDLVVVSKDAQSSGTVSFAPKTSAASATFVACTTKLSAPTSTTSDSDEIFVAEAGGIVAYHR